MKRLLLALLLFFPSISFADSEPEANHIWEAAVFGEIPGITYFRLWGRNAAPTTTYEPLWGESAVLAVRTAAMTTPYCASADANDTAAGTGARTITITGINTSFAAFSETLSLNGQTSVNLTTTAVLLIHSGEVITAGSGGVNAGIVRCGTGTNTAGVPAVVEMHIPLGENMSNGFIRGVPANKTVICRNFVASSNAATGTITNIYTIDTYTNLDILKRQHLQAGEVQNLPILQNMIKFAEKTIIIGQVLQSTASDALLSAECMQIDNTWEDTAQGIF